MSDTHEREVRELRSLYWSERDPDGRGFAPLADACRRAGAVDEARELLAEGLERLPHFASGHVAAARLYLDLGDKHSASESLTRVLELDAENAEALHGLGSIREDEGRAEDALTYFKRLSVVAPGDTSVSDRIRALESTVDEAVEGALPAASRAWDEDAAASEGAEEPLDSATDVVDIDSFASLAESAPFADVGDVDEDAAGVEDPADGQHAAAVEDAGGFEDVAGLGDVEPEGSADVADWEPIEDSQDGWDSPPVDAWGGDDLESDPVVVDDLAPEPTESEEWREAADALGAANEPGNRNGLTDEADIDTIEPVAMIDLAGGDATAEVGADLESGSFDLGLDPWPEDADEDEPDLDDELYTRTLAELYADQGLYDRAVMVYRHLAEADPEDRDLAARLDDLEALAEAGRTSHLPDLPSPEELDDEAPEEADRPARAGSGSDEDLEALAAELLAPPEDDPEVSTPFAWSDAEGEPALDAAADASATSAESQDASESLVPPVDVLVADPAASEDVVVPIASLAPDAREVIVPIQSLAPSKEGPPDSVQQFQDWMRRLRR